jgi:hypothetical protein
MAQGSVRPTVAIAGNVGFGVDYHPCSALVIVGCKGDINLVSLAMSGPRAPVVRVSVVDACLLCDLDQACLVGILATRKAKGAYEGEKKARVMVMLG